MNEINLISGKKEEDQKSKHFLKILIIVSVICILLTVASSVFVFYLKLGSPLPALKEKENTLLSQLSSSKDKIAKLEVLNDRLTNVDNIVSKRRNYNKLIDDISKNQSGNLRINSLRVGKKGVTLIVSSSSLSSINNFLDNLLLMFQKKEFFSEIVLNNVSSDLENRTYSISVDATLL